ncbi:hypothetical protein CU098_010690 [Rhizopus stolonifer]|uniref:Uncharacterized protein n=1 Tax=Rhizopus stolonifer TaxID=4846 RepID=A0A367KI98_RHIST|nr:hypothetical protein CU098_010690 [Rhizopus stolonifer]
MLKEKEQEQKEDEEQQQQQEQEQQKNHVGISISKSTSRINKRYYSIWCRQTKKRYPFSSIRSYRKLDKKHITKKHTASDWIPPINIDSLQELSFYHIITNLSLRHDLVFDAHLQFRPNMEGTRGKEKRIAADVYWKQVEHAITLKSFDFLKVVIQELSRLLISLMEIPGNWPSFVTKDCILQMLDQDLIVQQLKSGCFEGQRMVEFLQALFTELLMGKEQDNIESMYSLFLKGNYAMALRCCFGLIEAIRLNGANFILGYYRHFLITTCAEFELRWFTKNAYSLDSVVQWWRLTASRLGDQASFKEIYYAGLVYLISDTKDITQALSIQQLEQWPITLQFDEKRMTHQFRYEFQLILLLAIITIPYRHHQHFEQLKKTIGHLHQQHYRGVITQHQFQFMVWKACDGTQKDRVLYQNMKPGSVIFNIMYKRVCDQLMYIAQHGVCCQVHALEGLETELLSLGTKLKLLAGLNLKTFGDLYQTLGMA